MAVYDPRLDLARAASERVKSPSVQTLQSVMRQQGLQNAVPSSGQKDYFSEAAQKAAPQPGGWKGLLVDIMGSPLGKVVTEGGKLLAIPGKTIVSGIQEVADALDNDPNTHASFNDFTKQISNPEFGFGTVIGDLTGNKWVDRFLGLAGDLATDPLMWTTLGGSKAISMTGEGAALLAEQTGKRIGARVSGEAGRFALAERLAEFGASPEVQKAAVRFGRAGVKDAELLAKAGVDRAGLYFMGKRIAGTTRIGETLEKGLAGMRIWSGDHIFQKIGDAFTRADANEAILALRRGTAPAEHVAEFLHYVNSRNVERAAQAAGAREAGQAEINLLGTITEADIKAARTTAYKYVEQADTLVPDITTAEGRIAGPVKQWFKEMHDRVFAATKAVDPQAPIGEITNYFPHIYTDDAYRWMADESNAAVRATRGVVYNPFDPASAWKHRMVEGDMWFGEALTKEDIAGGIEQLNKLARGRGGLTFDFFETDLPAVMDKYTQMYGAQMGKIARKQYLADKGVFESVSKRIVEDPEWVANAEKRINTVTAERAKALAKVHKKLGDTTAVLDSMIGKNIKTTQSELEAALKGANISALDPTWELGWAKKQTLDALAEAQAELLTHQGSLEKLAGRTTGVVASLRSDYEGLQTQIKKLVDDIASGEARDINITERIAVLRKNIASVSKTEEKVVGRSNIMQLRMDEILTGEKIVGHKKFADKVYDVLFAPPKSSGVSEATIYGERAVTETAPGEKILGFAVDKPLMNQAKGNVKRWGKVANDEQKVLLEKLEYQRLHYDKYGYAPESKVLADAGYAEGQGIKYANPREAVPATSGPFSEGEWKMINGSNPISRERIVEAAKAENMQSVAAKALRGEASMEELRAVGIAMLAGGDIVGEERYRLASLLSDASRSVTLQKQIDTIRRTQRGVVHLDHVVDNYYRIENQVVSGLRQYYSANTILDDITRMNVDPEALIPLETLYALKESHPSFASYFDIYAPEALDVQKFMETHDTNILGLIDGNIDDIPSISYRKLEEDLGKAIKNIPDQEYVVDFNLETAATAGLKNQELSKPRTIRLKSFIEQYKTRTSPEDFNTRRSETLDQYIEDFITGKTTKVEEATAGAARSKAKGAKVYTGKDVALENDFSKGMQSLREQLAVLRKQQKDLYEVQMYDAAGQKEVGRVQRLVQTGQATKDDLIIAQQKANKDFYENVLKPMGFGSDVPDHQSVLNELQNVLPIMHFSADLQRRTSDMTELLISQGLVPGKDNFVNLINSVAKQHYGAVESELSSLRVAKSKISDLIETINTTNWQGREAELYDYIGARIHSTDGGASGWADAIARTNGRADADRIWKQMKEFGVTGTKSGIPNRRAKLIQQLKDKTLTDAVRASKEAELEALPKGAAFTAMKKKFKDEVLRPWYLKNIDSTATKASYEEMVATMQPLLNIKNAVGRYAEDASVNQMKTWLEESLSRLSNASKVADSNSSWLRQASDPFLDINKFVFGHGTEQSLPGMYIDSLSSTARKLETLASELDGQMSRLARREGALLSRMPEEEAAKVLAERLSSGRTQGQLLTSKTQGMIPDQFAPIVDEEALKKLETIPEDILPTLKDDAAKAKYIKNAKAKYTRDAELVAAEYLKQEERALQAARKAFTKYNEAKNTGAYMDAVERKSLNDLIKEFAPYSFEDSVPLTYKQQPHEVATTLFKNGNDIYHYSNDPSISKYQDLSKATKITDVSQLSPGGTYYVVNDGIKTIIGEGRLVPLKINGAEVRFTPQEIAGIFGDSRAARAAIEEDILAIQYRMPRHAKEMREFLDSFKISDEDLKLFSEPVKRNGKPVYLKFQDLTLAEKYQVVERYANNAGDHTEYYWTRTYKNKRGMSPEVKDAWARTGEEELRKKWTEGIKNLQYSKYQDQLKTLQKSLLETDPMHQQAGLEKMNQILQGIKRGELTQEDVINALRQSSLSKDNKILAVDSATRKGRLKELSSAWEGSKQQEVFDHVASLEQDSAVADYHRALSQTDNVQNSVEKIRAEIRAIRGEYNPESAAPFGTKRSIGQYTAKKSELLAEQDAIIARYIENGSTKVQAKALFDAQIKIESEKAARVALSGTAQKEVNTSTKTFRNAVKKLIDEEGLSKTEAFDQAFKNASGYEVDTVAGAQYRMRVTLDRFRKDLQAITDATGGQYDATTRMADLREQGLSFIEAKNVVVDEVNKLRPEGWVVAESATAVKNLRDISFNESQIGFFERVLNDDSNLALYFTRQGKGAREGMAKRVEALQQQATPLKKMLDEQVKLVASKPVKEELKAAGKLVSDTQKKITSLEATLLDVAKKFDAAKVNKLSSADHWNNVVMPLKNKLDRLNELLARSKSLTSSSAEAQLKRAEFDALIVDAESVFKEVGRKKVPRPGMSLENGQMVKNYGYENTAEYDKFLRVKSDYVNAHMDFMMSEQDTKKAMFALSHDFFNENLGTQMVTDLKEGWTTLESLGMPSRQAKDAMMPIITAMERFQQPDFVRGVNSFLGRYTGFFKAYALSSPGFVVRNTLTNTFSLFAAGAETKNLVKGLGLYREWQTAIKAGTEKVFIEALPEEERKLFTIAVSSSDASGYGRSGEAFANWHPKKASLADNKYTRVFRKYNEQAEGSARFMLGYDSAVQGYDMHMAAARVKRYLFDYTDIGKVDESLRGVVPFWFWMSRNLPMQVVNKFLNPRPYLLYSHIMQNLGQNSQNDIVPKWMQDAGAVKLSGNTFLTPDLGFNKMDEQFAMLSDPKRLLGYVNPGLRVPFEVLGNTHLNSGVPFGTKTESAMGGPFSPVVDALAAFMGQQRQLPNGDQGVTSKMNYAMSNLFPPIGQAEGVMPTSAKGQENQGNKIMSLLGIPLTTITPGMQESERRRQLYEQNALRNIASGGK